ncbi:hypothetical protein HK405_005055, partial [Cladochytrium tenue]
MIPLRPTSNIGGGGGGRAGGGGGGRRPSVPPAAAAASLAPSPTSRLDLEAGRSSSDPSSATVQMLTVGGNDSDTDADSFDGNDAGGRTAGTGPDSGTRMFRKLDIRVRVNSIGVRLAHFLRNPRVLMAVLGALLIAIVLVAVSGQDNPDKDGSYTHREPNGDIILMHVASSEKRTLAKSQDLKDAWVRDNDIYVTMDTTTEIRLTSDGSSDIINGVSDWVYEEEVLNSHAAMWFSSDGTKLAYLKFDDSGVPDVHLQRFFTGSAGASVYPLEVSLKYPKAGKPNPVVTLHIATPSSSTMARRDSTVRFEDPDDLFPDEDRLIVEVKWVSNSELIVRMMNRVQDAQRLFYVTHRDSDGADWIARKIRDETNEDESWFPRLQAITVIPPLPSLGRKNPSYIELREDDEGFTHLAYYDSVTDSVPSAWLTRGSWEVTDVAAVDPQRGLVYFLSTEEGSTQRHLYSVTLDGTSKTRLSPPQNGPDWGASVRTWNTTRAKARPSLRHMGVELPLSEEDEGLGDEVGKVGFYSASFSPAAGYYLLTYEGPDVPWQKVIGVDDDVDAFKTKNKDLANTLRGLAMPRQSFFTVPVDDGVDVNVKLIVPHDFDRKKKYPLLVKIYGGPNSQTVKQVYEVSFEQRMVADGFVALFIDPRGTGARGRAFRSVVSKHLGLYEAHDIIAATRHVVDLGFIDKTRVAIWGWSYGGFLSSKVIEADSGVFTKGIAVAPVIDWKFYDSIYTERFMKTPQLNPEGYDKSAVKEMDGFKHVDFLLVHGTYDDNVHFQNSAMLVWQFTQQKVRTYRSQFFPDSDHSMSAAGAFDELHALLRSFLRDPPSSSFSS